MSGDLLVCLGGFQDLDGVDPADVIVDTVEVVNLATGEVTQGSNLPVPGYSGCAAVH